MMFQLEKRKNLHDAILAIIAFASATVILLDLFGCEGMDMNSMAASDTDADSDTDSDSDTDTDSDTDSNVFEGAVMGPTTQDECDTDNPVALAVLPDDSNGMAGPALARFLLSMGRRVDRRVRPNEFLNYYRFGYEAPPPDHVSVEVGMAAGDIQGRYEMQVGVRAPDPDQDGRKRFNLTLAVDTSESMAGLPIQRAKQICVALAGSLEEGDIVSITTLDPARMILLSSHPVTGPQDPVVISNCNSLAAGSQTDLQSGLGAAYQLAHAGFSWERTNSVILVSDGAPQLGTTSAKLILDSAHDGEEPVYLMGAQVGDPSDPGAASESLMRTVTDAGKGAYVFVDSASEAAVMFTDRLMSILETAARDVRLEIDLPPSHQVVAFRGEGFATDPSGAIPQDLGAGDELVFHLTLQSCEPSAVDPDEPVGVTVTYEDSSTGEARSSAWEGTIGEALLTHSPELAKGSATVEYATTLEAVRSVSNDQAVQLLESAIAKISEADQDLGGDQDLEEMIELLGLYLELL